MFFNDKDEAFIIGTFKAYVEEFGLDKVVVVVPESWRQYATELSLRVRITFGMEGAICVWAPDYNAVVSVAVRPLRGH